MVSVLIAIMIAVYTGKVIFQMVKNRKKSCSNCSGCPFSEKCR